MLAGNFVRASTFVYQDDFETDKAKYESWKHSPFVDTIPDIYLEGLLHYEPMGPSSRGLGFYEGYEVWGQAYLAYATIPQSAIAIGGNVQFFVMGKILIYGSTNGNSWTILGTAMGGWPPYYYSMPIRTGDPVQFLMLVGEGYAIIDDLEITIEIDKYSGGTGEPNDPYRIATAEDLNDIGNHPEDFNKCFVMTADINLAQYTGTQFNIIGDYPSKPFNGTFDGNGHKVLNFTYEGISLYYVGLFSFVSNNGQIKNLSVIDPNIVVLDGRYVAALVGLMDGGHISDCSVINGHVAAFEPLGGLVSRIWGNAMISNCSAEAKIIGNNLSDQIGILVGWHDDGTVLNCHSAGYIQGGISVGGLIGNMDSGSMYNCYSTAYCNGEQEIGGLVGSHSDSAIVNCYAMGTVTGGRYAGGLVGVSCFSVSKITNCYSTGNVSGDWGVGGLVGYLYDGTISSCYATGSVDGNDYVGGLVAYNYEGTVAASFWDVETSDCNSSAGGTPKTTAEMKTMSTFSNAGWDFVEIWGIGEHQTYPYLRFAPAGDLNYDKKVDFFDLAILAEHWLEER